MSAGILLAAGRGTRFGSMKQLATLPNGQTLLAASALNLRAAVARVTIVVSDDALLIEHALHIARAHDCGVVVNPRAREGMATSIECGINKMDDATGWLIALADMPFIQPASIAAIAAALTKLNEMSELNGLERLDKLKRPNSLDQIIVPTYLGQRGHPVAFGAKYAEELCQLTGDTGARDLIRLHQACVVLHPLDDAGIVTDIDTIAAMPA